MSDSYFDPLADNKLPLVELGDLALIHQLSNPNVEVQNHAVAWIMNITIHRMSWPYVMPIIRLIVCR